MAQSQADAAFLLEDPEPAAGDKPARAAPWGRFAVIWVGCSLASGLLPGSSLFIKLFADAGIYSSLCETPGTVAHDQLKDGCKQQFIVLTVVFSVGQSLVLILLAPIGLLYDRWGARSIGVAGAALCALGLSGVWLSVVGAAAGYDKVTSFLFLLGIFVCDFGSLLNSFSFFGLIWHFPGRQALIITLMNATYQASAFLPILFQTAMAKGISLASLMLGYAVIVLAVTYVCWLAIPPQSEYYAEAKRQLGMPLPRPPKELKVCKMLGMAVTVLRQDTRDHLSSAVAMSFAYAFPSLYSSFAAPYGEELFGSKKDGDNLATMYVSANGIVGLLLAPMAANIVDCFGLGPFVFVLACIVMISAGACGIADWRAQGICCVLLVLFNGLFSLFYSRYLLCYSPPNRLGTVQGVYVVLVMLIAIPLMTLPMIWVSMLPPGPDAYRLPMHVCGGAGAAAMFIYTVYFKANPPPDIPPLLAEDEAELARNFGCANLEEVMEVVNISSKRELLKKLSSTDPDVMHSLIKSIDTNKMMEMMAKRSIDDVAAMMEDGEVEDDEEQEEEISETPKADDSVRNLAMQAVGIGAADSTRSEAPLLENLSPREEVDALGVLGGTFGVLVRVPPAPYVASTAEHEDGSETEEMQKEMTEEVSDLCERYVVAVRDGDKETLTKMFMSESVDDLWEAMIRMEDRYTKAELASMEKQFNKLIPPKAFAKMLRDRAELRTFVQKAMKRELDRKIGSLRRKK